jgi:hypothetical protein
VATGRAVERYGKVREFLAATQPWLLAAEADNNLLFSVACVLTTDDHPFHGPAYFAAVKEAGRVIGCALCAPPDGLELGDLPVGAAALLVDSVAALHPGLASVSGSRRAALEFARSWVAKRGGGWRVRYEGMLFRLAEVEPPPPTPGQLRLAVEGDAELLDQWAERYARAIDTHVDVAALFARMRRRGMLHLWDDGGPKCAVGESGTTPNGTRINAVYTPDEFRNRGYASNAVAAVSAGALARGNHFCVLFAEPEPGRIYERLGYRPLREHLIVEISGAAGDQ